MQHQKLYRFVLTETTPEYGEALKVQFRALEYIIVKETEKRVYIQDADIEFVPKQVIDNYPCTLDESWSYSPNPTKFINYVIEHQQKAVVSFQKSIATTQKALEYSNACLSACKEHLKIMSKSIRYFTATFRNSLALSTVITFVGYRMPTKVEAREFLKDAIAWNKLEDYDFTVEEITKETSRISPAIEETMRKFGADEI